MNNKRAPNLAGYDDIADYILKHGAGNPGYSSESEVEDLPNSKITLPEDFMGRKKNSQVALRLNVRFTL